MHEHKIAIIGAGITGISIARACQQAGISYDWYEKESEPGGLLRTDCIDGFALDHGFQVLQSGYTHLKELYASKPYSSYCSYARGAWMLRKGSRSLLSHPGEGVHSFFKTLINQDLSLGDKVKVLLLQRFVANLSEQDWQNRPQLQQTSMAFLQSFGFSANAIDRFFKPWFSGVFLEPDLSSPASLFCLFYKAFSQGGVLLPPGGIQQFPRDLVFDLPEGNRYWGKEVNPHFNGKHWEIEGKPYSHVVWAAGSYSPNSEDVPFRSAETLYFACDQEAGLGRYLALNSSDSPLIQTLSIPSNVETSYAPAGQCLWSIQLRPTAFGADENEVWAECQQLIGASLNGRFLKRYRINRALPELHELDFTCSPECDASGLYYAGAQQGYPSLQSAWLSGQAWVRNLSLNQ